MGDKAISPLKEIRIGLVLYGGVSLAVYMNGITTELWHLLRASQARRAADAETLAGTAAIYRRLLDALQETVDLRVVVDAIAGSSAGGVNGASLAKAICDGADAAVLGEVWIRDADIAALRVEPPKVPWWLPPALWAARAFAPVRDLRRRVDALPGLSWDWLYRTAWSVANSEDGHATPLDGRYFTRMIAKTFGTMAERGNGVPLIPTRGALDLFLTRTDFAGWPRHLPVSDEFHPTPLYETTHAHVMAFRSAPGPVEQGAGSGTRPPLADDFALTYACRTTAGFPGAFAPLGAGDAATDFAGARPDLGPPDLAAFTARHLREHQLFDIPAETAWMIDGGVLDNRPFTDLARAIERKPADHEVFRIVAYVEPDPDARGAAIPDPAMPRPRQVLGGLYGLLRHEPINDDLRALGDRNARVERIKAVRDANRKSIKDLAARLAGERGLAWPPSSGALPRWDALFHSGRAGGPDVDYPGYAVLRARCAAEALAGMICTALAFPRPSRHAWFVRSLVHAWLDAQGAFRAPEAAGEAGSDAGYRLTPAQDSLLGAFDVATRLRRLRALVHALNQGYGDLSDAAADADVMRAALDTGKTALADVAFGYERLLADVEPIREQVRGAFGGITGPVIDREIARLRFDAAAVARRFSDELRAIYEGLAGHFARACTQLSEHQLAAIEGLPEPVRTRVATEHAIFPLSDRFLLPLMDAAGVEDLITVRAMRISPRDGTLLADGRGPLLGRGLGGFFGFLDRHAREHDLLWGRLDAVERLVAVLLSAAAPDPPARDRLAPLCRGFAIAAMRAAVAEERARPGSTIGELAAALDARLARMEAAALEAPVG